MINYSSINDAWGRKEIYKNNTEEKPKEEMKNLVQLKNKLAPINKTFPINEVIKTIKSKYNSYKRSNTHCQYNGR